MGDDGVADGERRVKYGRVEQSSSSRVIWGAEQGSRAREQNKGAAEKCRTIERRGGRQELGRCRIQGHVAIGGEEDAETTYKIAALYETA